MSENMIKQDISQSPILSTDSVCVSMSSLLCFKKKYEVARGVGRIYIYIYIFTCLEKVSAIRAVILHKLYTIRIRGANIYISTVLVR